MRNRLILFGMIIFAASCIIGCNESGFGYVTGKVLIDGKPAQKDLVVRFHPQAPGGSYSTGITDNNGNYEMHFSISKKGVQTGPCTITVEFPQGDELPGTPGFMNKYNEHPPVYEVKPGKQKYDISIDTKSKK